LAPAAPTGPRRRGQARPIRSRFVAAALGTSGFAASSAIRFAHIASARIAFVPLRRRCGYAAATD